MMTKYASIALALLLSSGLVSSVTYARPLGASDKPGYQARGQAGGVPSSLGEVSAHRAQALRECTERANKLLQKDWGVRQLEVEGACMAEHGEPQ
jgi:hypothetical protein